MKYNREIAKFFLKLRLFVQCHFLLVFPQRSFHVSFILILAIFILKMSFFQSSLFSTVTILFHNVHFQHNLCLDEIKLEVKN